MFLNMSFGCISVFLVAITIGTSLQVSLPSAWPSIPSHPWAMATRYDAYLGLWTFFCWRAWRKRSRGGEMAMSFYVRLHLRGLPPDDSLSAVFRQKAA